MGNLTAKAEELEEREDKIFKILKLFFAPLRLSCEIFL